MRLCIYNPHGGTGLTGKSFFSIILGKNFPLKYGFLIRLLKDPRYNAVIAVDGTQSSLPLHYIINSYLLTKIISFFEIYIWCLLNGISPFRTKIVFKSKELDSKNDILFGFYGPFTNNKLLKKSFYNTFTGKKLFHFTHYFTHTKKVSEGIKKTNIHVGVAEADLKKSDYFNKFYPFIKKIYILPFALRSKYMKISSFKSRKNKCLALGTLHDISIDDSTKDYMNYFKVNYYHTMRKLIYVHIYERKDKGLLNLIDVPVAELPFSKKDKFISKKYFSFDMVKKLNEYKMFLAPEENVGVPSINFVDGMGCGCAYIGLRHKMYSDIGMIDKRHYIGYNGTIEDLKKKIKYYQKNPEKLRVIADNGYKFVKSKLPEDKITDNFWNDLNTYSKTGKLRSSFKV